MDPAMYGGMPPMYGNDMHMAMAPTAMQSRGGHSPMMAQQQHLKRPDEFGGHMDQASFNNGPGHMLGAKNAGANYGYGMSPREHVEESQSLISQYNTTGSHNQPGASQPFYGKSANASSPMTNQQNQIHGQKKSQMSGLRV